MALAYIGLGSNLSDTVAGQELDSRAQLNLAIDSLSAHPHILVSKRSSFYQTPAIGPGEQPNYINAVAQLDSQLAPLDLLDLLQSIENQQGRVRTVRWGARTLDLDILLYDQLIENSERLTVPHPRMHERGFVLAPLSEIAPDLCLPNGENIQQLLANCSMQGIVKL
ncbi:2-amino-4-hydroxy-6-hydroxymethyldihydropteridine diphosphokinase [Porticoccaceae bacterium]|jgi:2-amino-4-hydroxy-6-hydroxymethyldihydropteridine diphosphokinase|nr:2-amino-4-hydroxy-6-hydroxymethyldihydropteridine diphosphokinase [Porticoccaceae bacterium]MCT2532492.1 2-amino-4-hydroxy-6-hydroxymethyldihydropteridine diphosphokinase [SAR92 clade bacterium H231]MBT6320020.1 2-amino-4-hydroxy-6-hydroxymethyldihydropteridine diphosphokinase [Porticoccaceae bacterium]MBT7258426.1 2-amino-4-hydroxy-6-hydroxymethyldihydropteridine diphosphokinase [Porticoccaceae bacterium]MBT7905357.1 2-amino-4-hydroxy-6-hydroxymethyldihydropteridine diphosphokinase [Portico